MSDIDFTGSNSGRSYVGSDRVWVEHKVVDFSETNITSSDVAQCINIPAGTYVVNAGVKVITAEGGTCTANLGDGDTTNGFADAVDLNAAAGTMDLGAGGAGSSSGDPFVDAGGKFYASADTLDLEMDNDADAAKVVVWALMVDLSHLPSS